jgi:2,5-diamino-6-(ribosylamino)-4(3H)-pyrimidinone 5'-phosphate reductase
MISEEGVYPRLEFGTAPPDRPYVYINMVATIDGKTVSGGRDEPVQDLGSELDHATMRQIERTADAVLIGAGSLRATRGIHYPKGLKRIVASASGDVPTDRRFFTDEPENAFIATTKGTKVPGGIKVIECGTDRIEWRLLLSVLRGDHGVQKLLLEGGSEINASLLHEDLVDELFLTVAPKVKLGRDVPTYAGGKPLPRDKMLQFRLVSCAQFGDEVFVRYRRDR